MFSSSIVRPRRPLACPVRLARAWFRACGAWGTFRAVLAIILALHSSACGDPPAPSGADASAAHTDAKADGGLDDASLGDASLGDASLGDASLGDASLGDASLGDASLSDGSLGDASLGDASLGDSSVGDGGLGDASLGDAKLGDGGLGDASASDADAGGLDGGHPDADGGSIFRDEDLDTISDHDEGDGLIDTDDDGVPDSQDEDSDNDGILDRDEAGDISVTSAPIDTDFDGIPDFRDLDADGDWISDAEEGTGDLDRDGIPNFRDIDSDGDGILDRDEAGDSDPASAAVDTDQDGTPDFLDLDSDNDTIADATESTRDGDADGIPDYLDDDSDQDGHLDRDEVTDDDLATPPDDTDGDGIFDFRDLDADGDGLRDADELGCPGSTDAHNADSDGDGFQDTAEIAYGSNPCDAANGIDGFYFVLPPLGPVEDAPLVFEDTDIDRADLAINIDTTSSMRDEIENLQTTLSNVIIPGVAASVPDPGFAVSSFEDYPVAPFGNPSYSDRPFELKTRVTTDGTQVQAAVDTLEAISASGGNIPESGLEALYQIATGAGTSWPSGQTPAFDPAVDLVPGVADGAIGGVGFRNDSLPIVVHITDALSHVGAEYQSADPRITAAGVDDVQTALLDIGARVITVANSRLPRALTDSDIDAVFQSQCTRATAHFFGRIEDPVGHDIDWFRLDGSNLSGHHLVVETYAARLGSTLDSLIVVVDQNGVEQDGGTQVDDILAYHIVDSRFDGTLTGSPPYYIGITAFGDTRDAEPADGEGSDSAGFYFVDVSVDGQAYGRSSADCPAVDDGNVVGGATALVPFSSTTDGGASCIATCRTELAYEPLALPYGIAQATEAAVPTCAWDRFGGGTRPTGCGADECCTGLDGVGVAPSARGDCPLSYQIDDQGHGLGATVVAGIEALVHFAAFTVTAVARPDPAELTASGLDTSCFIRRIVPVSASTVDTCAPEPIPADLLPPSPELDSFQNVVPGTELSFRVDAQNEDNAGEACRPATEEPQMFRAFIDVVADGVTVVDTRDVIIIVPPAPPSQPL
ncbi:MAG: hypothetical protein H6729_10625 [Deltaproteobacteria bacterium]|nr:hypothetical protein [Deltaproteobacteria bacterium]